VLAYRRHYAGDQHTGRDLVICVNNMSRFPQPVELDLSEHAGHVPVELTGGVHFPPVGELPYLLTLPGHGFYWFQLVPPETGRDP
jgi:maltose alpha-D-glucosyltransferase/alpha-amylase